MSPKANSIADIHQHAAAKLAASAQRYTANRREIVSALAAAAGPATIGTILAGCEHLAQSSTYRNLVALEASGVVVRIITADDHAHFELAEDVTGHHHHHLVCEQCGKITDVTLEPQLESQIDAALSAAANERNFAGSHHRVDLLGRCEKCL